MIGQKLAPRSSEENSVKVVISALSKQKVDCSFVFFSSTFKSNRIMFKEEGSKRNTSSLPPFLQRKIRFKQASDSDISIPMPSLSMKKFKTSTLSAGKDGILYQDFDNLPFPLHWSNITRIGPGLANLGNTCYLNSVLQCFTYTAPLSNYLLSSDEHYKKCRMEGFCLLCEMRNHLIACQKTLHSLCPNNIVSNLKLIGKHFRLGRQEDSHEFIRFMIDGMQKSAINQLKLNPQEKEKSLIYAIFGGYLQNTIICSNCRHTSIKRDPFLDLSLDVKDANTLEKAIKHFTRSETLTGSNRYNCEACKSLSEATKCLQIQTPPNILTIQLKRFQMHGYMSLVDKICKIIDFPPELEVPIVNNQIVSYDLYAIIVHEGMVCNSGHYHAFVKASNGTWYSMNDSSVQQVGLGHVLKQKAYILFYQKKSLIKENSIQSTVTANDHQSFITSSSMWHMTTNSASDIAITTTTTNDGNNDSAVNGKKRSKNEKTQNWTIH